MNSKLLKIARYLGKNGFYEEAANLEKLAKIDETTRVGEGADAFNPIGIREEQRSYWPPGSAEPKDYNPGEYDATRRMPQPMVGELPSGEAGIYKGLSLREQELLAAVAESLKDSRPSTVDQIWNAIKSVVDPSGERWRKMQAEEARLNLAP
jgi:hypothetical protein